MDINFSNLFIDIIITATAYLFIPFILFYKRVDNYDLRKRKKIILFNSITIAFLFIFITALLKFEQSGKSFIPALFYYYVNNWIWCKRNTNHEKSYNKIKDKSNDNNNTKIIAIAIVLITLIISVTTIICFKIKEDSKYAYKEKMEQKLADCLDNADDLHSSNITIDSNGNLVVIDSDLTSELEYQYQRSVDQCYKLYGN